MKICPNCKAEYAGGEVFCPVDGCRLSTRSQMVEPSSESADDPLIGITLGDRYKILRPIGEGGMGIVYEAKHVVIEKHVALKVLRDDFSRRPEVVERFRQEAKSASRIGHENIVDISDFGETPTRQSYFVMEYLEGEDLANVLSRDGTVVATRAVDIILQCCKALGAAHSKGIVHRDMKPENIFLIRRDGRDDFVKIVDFGIAKMSDIETDGAPGRKLTKTGMIFGTPEYMSPEQAAGKGLDHRVDIYALGVILFEMLAGRVPFVGDTFMGVLTQHMFEDIPTLRMVNPRAVCPPELERVIQKALAKVPEERYGTMSEFAAALTSAMDMSGVTTFAEGGGIHVSGGRGSHVLASEAAPTAEFELTPPRRRRGKGLLVAASVLAVAGLGGLAYFAIATADPASSNAVPIVSGPAVTPDAGVLLAALDPTEPAVIEGEGDGDGIEVAASTDAGQAREPTVTVTVHTRPAGAAIMVDGKGTVCPQSPCSFETPVGEHITVRARHGAATGARELQPEEETTLEMSLSRRIRNPRPRGSGEGMSPRGMVSDLKTPPIFEP